MSWEIPITSDREDREALIQLIRQMPVGWRLFVSEPVHTPLQRKKFNAMCTDLSRQVKLGDEHLSQQEWKHWLVAAWKHQRMLPGEQGTIVFVGEGLKKRSIVDVSELIELAYATGAERDVVWSKESQQPTEEGTAT